MEEEVQQDKELIHVSIVVAGIVIIFLLSIVIWHTWTQQRQGSIVLHSGYTYTGPTPVPTNGQTQPSGNGKFTVSNDAPWKTVKGVLYPYSFVAPEALNLIRFPNDPYDIYAISWNNMAPDSNVLIGVDNLSQNEKLRPYITQPKRQYVENWWKQFGSLSGISQITPFTNKAGLVGYKAKFLMGNNPAPSDDVFFEVPHHNELVIHLSNGVLDQPIFEKIIDSVSWSSTAATVPGILKRQ